MLVSLVKIDKNRELFYLKEKLVNSEDVSTVEPSLEFKQKLKEGLLPKDLSPHHEFSVIVTKSGEKFTVVGSCKMVSEKLGKKKDKMLLFD